MCPPTLIEAIFKAFFKHMQKPSFVTNFSIHPYISESVDTQQAFNMINPSFYFAISFL